MEQGRPCGLSRPHGHGEGRRGRPEPPGMNLTQVGPVRDDEPLLPVLQTCRDRVYTGGQSSQM
jgi:hypothetical protein